MEKLKISILASMIMAFVMVITSGCSNKIEDLSISSTSNEQELSIEEAEFIETLQMYNQTLTHNTSSRGIGWIGWLSVAVADAGGAYQGAKFGAAVGAYVGPQGAAIGAAAGGLIAGGAASYGQYNMANSISQFSPYSMDNNTISVDMDIIAEAYLNTKDTCSPSDLVLGLSLGLDTCSTVIGVQHNQIMDLSDNFASYVGTPSLTSLNNVETNLVYNTNFINLYNNIVSDPLYMPQGRVTLSDQVMQLFIDAVYSGCTSQTSLDSIVRTYVNAVNSNTSLSDNDKRGLMAGFSVMEYSFQYWSEKWPYEE